jgi:AraC-like DNA-binding protein
MPYKIDLFAIFILLGIVQAAFLCFFFFSGENRKIKSNLFQGIMLLSMALCNLEILLMYTGYIRHCLWLVDFSEPLAFLIGPSFYLMVLSLIHGEIDRKHYWHFAFPVIYLILIIPFYLQPEVVKYNSWIYSFRPGFEPIDHGLGETRWFWITDHHTQLTLFNLGFYALLGAYTVVKAFRDKRESLLFPKNAVLRKLRAGAIQVVTATIFIFIIKAFYESDTGDHWFAAYISLVIYITSFRVLNQSGFFRQAALNESPRKQSVTTEGLHAQVVSRLRGIMESQKPYLQPGFSLPDMAQQMNLTVHQLSQAINEGMGKSFFEMVAEYRVAEAKRLLVERPNVKIEEIAEQVGYNSKSSFNTVFKKVTGVTPSEFRSRPSSQFTS